jgi:hypothetical protein
MLEVDGRWLPKRNGETGLLHSLVVSAVSLDHPRWRGYHGLKRHPDAFLDAAEGAF